MSFNVTDAVNENLLTSLFNRSVLNEATGCRTWAKGTSTQGKYGSLGHNGTVCLAHRVAYEAAYGADALPKGSLGHETNSYELHHRCHNRLCIEPTHLKVVTRNLHSAEHKKARRNRIAARAYAAFAAPTNLAAAA